jgi:hypothetical protein
MPQTTAAGPRKCCHSSIQRESDQHKHYAQYHAPCCHDQSRPASETALYRPTKSCGQPGRWTRARKLPTESGCDTPNGKQHMFLVQAGFLVLSDSRAKENQRTARKWWCAQRGQGHGHVGITVRFVLPASRYQFRPRLTCSLATAIGTVYDTMESFFPKKMRSPAVFKYTIRLITPTLMPWP